MKYAYFLILHFLIDTPVCCIIIIIGAHCYEVVAMVAASQWLIWLYYCDVTDWYKQSCVTMVVDL